MPKTQKLPIDTKASASEMADAMFGTGIEIVSASYSGAGSASGIYSDGDSIAPHLTPSDTGVILSTGKATAVTSGMGDSNQSSGTSTNHGRSGDKDLEDIAGTKTFDAAVIEAEFVPQGSELTMQITFSSEEYLEYAGSGFNDAVGVFVNGEKAELTIGDGDITINNINDVSNQNLYVDNPAHAEVAETEMDGFTVTLTLKAPVNPGEVNSIKIAIADGGDGAYDSNLMIAGNSVQTALIARDDELTLTENSALTLNVLTNDSTANGGTLSLTHINGQAVEAGDSVELATGETITLNPDGTFSVVAAETPGSSAFSYRVADGSGNSDTAFVTLHTEPDVACFVAGTLIQTATGHQPVELLTPGTMVWT
ncbi:choice-of-anchor L domain-containing protein [Primorskyibacter sp. S87]|uniref:choice-of-anchor L domain-containing protein n=1 Tax=Primorskyibacter sp. S87 TaxID=3415126 RepID=UPI003C7C049D